MRRVLAIVAGLAALVAANAALAQSSFSTDKSNINVPGAVAMCRGTDGIARPCDGITPMPVIVTGGISNPQYPVGARPVTCIGTGSTGAVVGTCAAAPGKTTWLCGFDVSSIGGTAQSDTIKSSQDIGDARKELWKDESVQGLVVLRKLKPVGYISRLNVLKLHAGLP